MLNFGCIKNDFDARKSAAPKLLAQAASKLPGVTWKPRTASMLPETAAPLASTERLA